MLKVLLAHEIAKACFLNQALLYCAVGRLPLEVSEDEAINPILTPEECRAGGLQPDPEWEEGENGEGERLLNATVAAPSESKERKSLYEQWIKWKAVQEYRRNEWNSGFQKLLKRRQSDLLTALIEGRLRSQGQQSGLLTKEDMSAEASWMDVPWEAIPSTFWSSSETDWEKCRAEGSTAAYDSIVVETEDLFRQFPLPVLQDTVGVRKSGNYFILSDEGVAPSSKSGRPPYPWDEFDLELAKLLVRGAFPEKQDALVDEMQKWCERCWGKKPAISTLKQRLKPYYDAFVRTDKVRK